MLWFRVPQEQEKPFQCWLAVFQVFVQWVKVKGQKFQKYFISLEPILRSLKSLMNWRELIGTNAGLMLLPLESISASTETSKNSKDVCLTEAVSKCARKSCAVSNRKLQKTLLLLERNGSLLKNFVTKATKTTFVLFIIPRWWLTKVKLQLCHLTICWIGIFLNTIIST